MGAKNPTRATSYAAGIDLYSCFNYVVPAHGKVMIATGVSMTMPFGTYGRLASKSGNSLYHSLEVGAGIVDSDYTGEIWVLLYNFSKEPYLVKKGHPVAQLVLEKAEIPDLVYQTGPTKSAVRGNQGFGSRIGHHVDLSAIPPTMTMV